MKKKLLAVLLFFLLFPLTAWNFEFSFGCDTNLLFLFYNSFDETTSLSPYLNVTGAMATGLYIDFFFARLTFNYLFSISNFYYSPEEGCIFSLLTIEALAKLPVIIDRIRLWTAVGFQYAICLTYNNFIRFDENWPIASALDDFYLVTAVSGELHLAKNLTIGSSFKINYNLTPVPILNPPSNTSYEFIIVAINLYIGFVFDF